jgi:hypothetical protein
MYITSDYSSVYICFPPKKRGGGRKEVNLSKYSFTDRKIKTENVALETKILPHHQTTGI